jgi:long-subunit fatty acid transport protein
LCLAYLFRGSSDEVHCRCNRTVPDANQNVITLGLGWKSRHHSLEAAYGLDFYDERQISNNQNPAFNGKYTFNVHLFSLAYSYSF